MAFSDSIRQEPKLNKGLAYERKSLYPEIIGMMKDKQQSDTAKAKVAYDRGIDDLDWLDKQAVDTSALDQADAAMINESYNQLS